MIKYNIFCTFCDMEQFRCSNLYVMRHFPVLKATKIKIFAEKCETVKKLLNILHSKTLNKYKQFSGKKNGTFEATFILH